VDIDLEIGGNKFEFDNFVHGLVPEIVKGKRPDVAPATPLAAAVVCELVLAANNIINVLIPAATAAAMGKLTPGEAAGQAEAGAYISAGIPGSKGAAAKTGQVAAAILEYMEAAPAIITEAGLRQQNNSVEL
jgi:hypothetical protein